LSFVRDLHDLIGYVAETAAPEIIGESMSPDRRPHHPPLITVFAQPPLNLEVGSFSAV